MFIIETFRYDVESVATLPFLPFESVRPFESHCFLSSSHFLNYWAQLYGCHHPCFYCILFCLTIFWCDLNFKFPNYSVSPHLTIILFLCHFHLRWNMDCVLRSKFKEKMKKKSLYNLKSKHIDYIVIKICL